MNKKIIAVLMLSLGLNIYFVFRLHGNQGSDSAKENPPKYKLINPLQKEVIDSNIQADSVVLHYSGLKEQLEKEIGGAENEKNIGLFLQDSQTGAWLGINEKEGFNPASLLKMPIMMAILKKADRGEMTLSDKIKLAGEDLEQSSGQLYKKGAGYEISVWDLIKEMILASDNTAKNALKRQLSETELNAVFAHVGIPNPYLGSNGQMVTPRGYSRIFKSLYFSTFLPDSLSEKALDLATDTGMENLISAGFPPEIQVAHKYGERPDGISDCGIVYHPRSAYFLCVMTKDIEIPKARELIAASSKIIFDFVSNQNK
jgi:beta-lactamase class A